MTDDSKKIIEENLDKEVKCMKSYVGCKIIKAIPKTYGQYKIDKYGDTSFSSNISDDEEGYMVVYPPIKEGKKHFSWTPKKIFDTCYREIDENELSLIEECPCCE